MKLLFTGGGSGGHVFPLVAIAREIHRMYPKDNLQLYYAGPKDEFSDSQLSYEDISIIQIVSGKIRRYFSFENFIDIVFKIPFGIVQSFFILLSLKPDLVFSKGGSGSISVLVAAKLLKIPIFIHESDVVPGLSNQQVSKWAEKIFTSFPKTEYFDPQKITVTGNPIRKELLEGDKKIGAEMFRLSLSKPVILIIGGSQGAEALNDFVLSILPNLVKKYEIVHMTGTNNLREVEAEAQVIMDKNYAQYYHPIGFMNEDQAKHAYKVADIIISRSGSGSIFEISANGVPSILVPLPTSAGDHQSKNAYAYSENGACLVLEQQNLTPSFFNDNIDLLFLHAEKLEQMKQGALAFAKPMAARTIAREILEFLMLD